MNNVCFFTGHRQIESGRYEEISERVRDFIRDAAERGYKKFIAGGALGFDTMAALAVLELREELGLELIVAVPYPQQDERWGQAAQRQYRKILQEADEVVAVSDCYDRGCFHRRNRYMADRSSLCIAYYNGTGGGTKYTVEYALKNQIEIIFV